VEVSGSICVVLPCYVSAIKHSLLSGRFLAPMFRRLDRCRSIIGCSLPSSSPGAFGRRGRNIPSDAKTPEDSLSFENGTILVIAGETGSNASPQPNLETLPMPAGGPTTVP
jgi:hypothetical protein